LDSGGLVRRRRRSTGGGGIWQRAGHDLALNRHGAVRLACGARTPREGTGGGTSMPGRAGQGRWPAAGAVGGPGRVGPSGSARLDRIG
jgi:hypothetical protein